MAGETKKRIIETALALFSQSGYLATSMNDIAQQVGLTKAALYKHFSGKQEILDCIIAQMERMDLERAQEYEMPETEPDGFAEAYQHIPAEQIYAYSLAQFRHWTEEEFPARFRRMLTLEQYRDPEMGRLYRDYLAGGPVEYMAAIFRKMAQPGAQGKILRERNKLPESVPLFQLQGNFDVKKLHGMYRLMMEVMVKTAGKALASKSGRTAEEDDMLDMMTNGGERVRVENLHAVLAWYRGI